MNLLSHLIENGNLEIGVKQDINKAIELLEDISDELNEANEELMKLKN